MQPSSSAAAVTCRGLVKHYADVVAVNGLDLDVVAGECFGLLGPNGAGKTTTVEILEGLLAPTAGDVEILGRRWTNDDRWLREHLGISLQETHLPDKLTVQETLELFRSFFTTGRSVKETLALVALGDKENARNETLSGGQRQRLAVACALVGDPALLFLDEPTTGLDPQSRRMLWDVVLAFKDRGGTVLLTTHYMDEAQRLCDRVGVIDKGKMIAVGTPTSLIRSLGGDDIIELESDPAVDIHLLEKVHGVHAVRTLGTRVSLTVERLHLTLPALLAALGGRGSQLTNLSTHHATLEDVFVELTGRQLRE